MSKELLFSFVETPLPQKQFPSKTKVYDELLQKLKVDGKAGKSYQIQIVQKDGTPKKINTIYQALSTRLSKNEELKHIMKLHKFSTGIFIEMLEKPKEVKKK